MDVGNHLTGSYRVRVCGAALREARHWWPKTKDRMIVRRHAIKLRFWPEKQPNDDNGELLDLDFAWIRSLRKQQIGELRVQDKIGGQENIRIIFYVSESAPLQGMLPVIWILAAFPKKKNEFTTHQLDVFGFRRSLINARSNG